MDLLVRIGWLHMLYAAGLLILGLIVAKRVSALMERALSKRFSRHQSMLLKRLVYYGLLLVFIISALQELGFKMNVLLGTAGLLTVALGFASQTAASNLISGFFLLFERPFRIGDAIIVKNFSGTVEAIDLLSTKIRAADNTLIRIPNETIMKSEITNTSYYKTRKLEVIIPFSHKAKIGEVKEILRSCAEEIAEVLKDPAPEVMVQQFIDAGIELKLVLWAKTRDVTKVKQQINDLLQLHLEENDLLASLQIAEEK